MKRIERAVAHARERLALDPTYEGYDLPDGALTREWVAVRRTHLQALLAAANPGEGRADG